MPSAWSPRVGRAAFAGALAVALALGGAAAPAAEPELQARLSCERALAPGRVRCALLLEAAKELSLSWVDALVVRAPEFARPLRSRVPKPKLSGQDSQAEVLLALLANGTGRGTLTVRGRAVLCSRAQPAACRPAAREASVELEVGR